MTTNLDKNGKPAWLKRELRALGRRANYGGSSSFALFEAQAAGLAQKYNAWDYYKIFTKEAIATK